LICVYVYLLKRTYESRHIDLVLSRELNMAIKNKRPSKGLIVQSDRGSQY